MEIKPLMFILSICIATLVAFFFPESTQAKDCTLRIIGWERYMDQSFAKPFEQKYGCKVVATYAGSSNKMYAKIKASKGKTYNLVTASGNLTKRLYDTGLVEPLDLSKVPNYQDLLSTFQKPPSIILK